MGWIGSIFSRRRRYQDVAESITEHLDSMVEDLMEDGMSREEALRASRRQFGNVTRIRERSREVWQLPKLESFLSDIKYSARRLRKSPGFTITALLTLALGIGANAGIFTLIDAVLLKSLPVPRPEELYLVKENDKPAEKSRFSYPMFRQLEQQFPASSSIAAMSWPNDFYANTANGSQERIQGQLVSGNYFQVFETHPILGRLFTIEDDGNTEPSPGIVISYGYWKTRFAKAPSIVGQQIDVNGVPLTIIGVAAPGFFGAREGTEPDVWIPLTLQPNVRYAAHYSNSDPGDPLKPWVPQANIDWLQMIVRVKDPASISQTLSVLNRQYHQALDLRRHNVNTLRQDLKDQLVLEPGQQGFATLKRQFEQPLVLLMGMAAMVLLIVCANIANLLLARAVANERAIAVQLSMGAGRARLIRQTLTEALLLSITGGVLGIVVAFGCTTVLPKWASHDATAIPLNLAPDARILIFGVLVAIITGVLFGVAPAMHGSRVNPASVLKAGAKGISGGGANRKWSFRKTLVAAQVGLSLVLLVGAGMFTVTLSNYSKLDPGFDRDHILSASIDPNLVPYQPNELMSLYDRLVNRIDAIPGVESSSVATCGLASGCLDVSDVLIAGSGGNGTTTATTQENSVSINYFKTVGIQLMRGRIFTTTDNATAPRVSIVNQTFARRFLKDENPVGRQFAYQDPGAPSIEIVGLVADARVDDIREAAPPMIYYPVAQHSGTVTSIDIRTNATPQSAVIQVRQAIEEIDHRLPVVQISTLSNQIDRNLTQQRVMARLASIFGILALSLSCLGLYGVASYTMQRRTSEIGVRLALGSTRSAVVWLILKETLLVVTAGALAGVLFSVLIMHLVKGFLFGLSPEDPATIALAGSLLLFVSIGAGIFPAWRATQVNPTEALRFE
jgi:predicted permease